MVFKSNKKHNKSVGIAVVVPMFNEEVGAKRCVVKVIKTLKKINLSTILIVVNDGSTDKTAEILKGLKSKIKKYLYILEHKKNNGYGSAVRTGGLYAEKLNFRYVIVFDSDLTNGTDHIKRFADHYLEDWDLIKGSRFIKGGSMQKVPLRRRIFSALGNIIASSYFAMGIRDCTNGLRMIKTSFMKNIPYSERGFASILEELYYLKKQNAKCFEIANVLSVRKGTKSAFNYTPKVLFSYFKYAFKASLL